MEAIRAEITPTAAPIILLTPLLGRNRELADEIKVYGMMRRRRGWREVLLSLRENVTHDALHLWSLTELSARAAVLLFIPFDWLHHSTRSCECPKVVDIERKSNKNEVVPYLHFII